MTSFPFGCFGRPVSKVCLWSEEAELALKRAKKILDSVFCYQINNEPPFDTSCLLSITWSVLIGTPLAMGNSLALSEVNKSWVQCVASRPFFFQIGRHLHATVRSRDLTSVEASTTHPYHIHTRHDRSNDHCAAERSRDLSRAASTTHPYHTHTHTQHNRSNDHCAAVRSRDLSTVEASTTHPYHTHTTRPL